MALQHAGADRRAGAYSLGMRQRLGLAAALLGDPPVLILDEPGNGLDPQGVRTLRDLLRSHASTGGTVFVSSHLLGEVEHLVDDVIVINKPTGLVVHPGAGNADFTLVNALLFRWPQIATVGEPERPGIVHRLDKDTSGVLIVAKTTTGYTWLVKQFKTRKAKKSYMALVDGKPPTPTGRIETRIGRDEKHRQRMAVTYGDQGRKAESEFFTVAEYRDHTLLEVNPLSGRTHQIRVHLAFLGCPVVGDQIYGRRKNSLDTDRFFLHASKLIIRLPGNEEDSEFMAPLPADLQTILDQLEKA